MSNEFSNRWKHEYQKQGIPSSFRNTHSGSVDTFMDYLRQKRIAPGIALDVGCGTGRNSVYLAKNGFEVYSFDFVDDVVSAFKDDVRNAGYRIHVSRSDVTEAWPVPDGIATVVIDTFCYKHQIELEKRLAYRSQLARVLKPGGYMLLTLAGLDDGYYGPLLKSSPDPVNRVVVDPVIDVPSVLYDKQLVKDEFSNVIEFEKCVNKRNLGEMHGATYQRSTWLFIGRRAIQWATL